MGKKSLKQKSSEVKLQGVVLFPHRGDVVQSLTERKPPIAKLIEGHEMAQLIMPLIVILHWTFQDTERDSQRGSFRRGNPLRSPSTYRR